MRKLYNRSPRYQRHRRYSREEPVGNEKVQIVCIVVRVLKLKAFSKCIHAGYINSGRFHY